MLHPGRHGDTAVVLCSGQVGSRQVSRCSRTVGRSPRSPAPWWPGPNAAASLLVVDGLHVATLAELAERAHAPVLWVRAGEAIDEGCIERFVDKLVRVTGDEAGDTGSSEDMPIAPAPVPEPGG